MKKLVTTGTLLLAAGVLLSNCSNEELAVRSVEAEGNFTLNATVANCDTRTTVNDKYVMLWDAGDAINVISEAGKSTTLKLVKGENTPLGTFNGTVVDAKKLKYAIYPKEATLTSNEMTYEFPKAYTTLQSNAPMYSVIKDIKSVIPFSPLCGMMRLAFVNIPAAAGETRTVKLASKDGNITGESKVNISTATPVLASPADGATNAGKEVTVTVPATTAGDFFIDIPLPVATYSNGIEVTLSGVGDEDVTVTTSAGSKIECGKILVMPAFECITIGGQTPTFAIPAENATAAQDLLTSGAPGVSIKAMDTATDQSPLSIPVPASADAAKTPIFIGFEALTAAADKPVVINTTDGSYAPEKVTVAIGEVQSDAAPSVTLNMPKSSVSLNTTGSVTIYNKVTASTALNTLTVEEGVTVEELTVLKGNVLILGTVKKLVIDPSADTQAVKIEGKGACYEVVDNTNKVSAISTWDGKSTRQPAVKDATDQYTLIGGAAELAYLQARDIPIQTTGPKLVATIDSDTKLTVNIDLNDVPWAGMILGADKTFDGCGHTVSRVKVVQNVMSETGNYTPRACVGLFAAAKAGSVIKNITVDGFTATGDAGNSKWSGALVGYSNGAKLYSECHAKNVNIFSSHDESYRVGGLIGFISGSSNAVSVTDCSVTGVNITAEYSVGGFIGTILGGANRTISNCVADNVTINITKASAALSGTYEDKATPKQTTYSGTSAWAGYMSHFIGDVNVGGYTLAFADCQVTNSAALNTAAFGYNDLVKYGETIAGKYARELTRQEKEDVLARAQAQGTHYTLKEATTPLIPAQIDGGTIVVDGTSLSGQVNYNLLTPISKP